MQLPAPILGEITALTITTPDLDASFAYYQKLGFTEVFRADWPFPWIQITDSALLIMLRKDPKPYLALTYYVQHIDTVVADLEQKGITFTLRPKADDMIQRYIFRSPDGLNISLVLIVDGFYQPTGPTMLKMNQQDYFNPETYPNKVCGMFGELAHPVKDLQASIAYWKPLGFEPLSTFTSPYPWAILSDGISVIGLHQTTQFTMPAITYFAADSKYKIDALKAAGLTDYAEKGESSITLTTPEKQHINLFKLGM